MAEEKQDLFWADQLAQGIMNRARFHYLDKPAPSFKEFTVKTSASISGVLHIGRLSDTIRGSSVVRALRDQGAKTRFIWVAEDMDPLRKIPEGVPQSFREHIGKPVTDIPDPEGCHKTYAAHHVAEYFKVIDEFVQEPLEKFSMREEYQKGNFNEYITQILKDVDEVKAIQNRYRTNPLPAFWSPWTPICEKCGKIVTARITGMRDGVFEYECHDYQFETTTAPGCGHRGFNDPLKGEGKMLWKSEWAAQWKRWQVVSEGAGKEYQVPNSAWWINAEIVERVLDFPMPQPIFYEHLMVDGVKMSASLGNVVYPKDWLQVASPQLLRFLYNKRLMKTRSLSWKDLSQLYDEYDHAAKVSFGCVEEKDPKEKAQLVRLYAMANFAQQEEPLEMGFSYAVLLAQLYDTASAIEILKRTGHYQPLMEGRILDRLAKARRWIELYASAEEKLTLNEALPASIELSAGQRKALRMIASVLREKQLSEKELSEEFYRIASESGITSKELYQAGYRALLSKDRGPRLANFLFMLGERAAKVFETA